mgnify:CR=1 FL=1
MGCLATQRKLKRKSFMERGSCDGSSLFFIFPDPDRDSCSLPAKAVFGAAEKDRMEFLSADKRNVVLETVKKAEDGDGMIVRLYEVENARTKVTLHCAESILSAEETNLLEQPADGAIDVKENEISLTIKPYEIRTIRIRTEK